MNHLFIDSGFYIAWLNPDDQLHELAAPWMQRQEFRAVTSEFVLLEVAARLSQPPLRSLFSLLLDRVRTDRNTRLVRSSQGLSSMTLRNCTGNDQTKAGLWWIAHHSS